MSSKYKYDKYDHYAHTVSVDEQTNVNNSDLDADIVCPAGERTHHLATHPSCYCRIEKNVIAPTKDPNSYRRCTSTDYTECPVWRLNIQLNGSR